MSLKFIYCGVILYRIALVAVDNCMQSSLTGPFDLFAIASLQAKELGISGGGPLFSPVIVGPPGRTILDFSGCPIPITATFDAEDRYDVVFVPVIFGDLEPLLTDHAIIGWLSRQGLGGACLCSACAGSFLLAATGRLKGRAATTHWKLADSFAAKYPEVLLKREEMLVDIGDCITAGGVTAYLDLALYLTARFGTPELAAHLSKLLLIDPARRLQSPYRSLHYNKNHGDGVILKVQQWLEEQPAQSHSLAELAEKAALGERSLLRRFKKATGDSPLAYLQRLRIEKARRMLETTMDSVEDITLQVGYSDVGSFRKLFKEETGISPSQYRKRFTRFLVIK